MLCRLIAFYVFLRFCIFLYTSNWIDKFCCTVAPYVHWIVPTKLVCQQFNILALVSVQSTLFLSLSFFLSFSLSLSLSLFHSLYKNVGFQNPIEFLSWFHLLFMCKTRDEFLNKISAIQQRQNCGIAHSFVNLDQILRFEVLYHAHTKSLSVMTIVMRMWRSSVKGFPTWYWSTNSEECWTHAHVHCTCTCISYLINEKNFQYRPNKWI